MKKSQEIRGIIILGVSICITYFFTWKNLKEYREYLNQREEYLQKKIVKTKRYDEMQHQLKIMEASIPKIKEEKQQENSFSHVLEFEILLYKLLEKYQLKLHALGRIQKEDDRRTISGTIQGRIYDILLFLEEIENYPKLISLSEQYWKLEKYKYQEGILDCNFMFHVKEGEYDFSNIINHKKISRTSFVYFSEKERE
ncbi:hypothetical protein [Fusobacterium necrophorum]|uniref:Uncharacterized protein n=2 Tax=Fusobacterium necrophorum TaxID=859 RepID=A0A017H245_9FUSO|nr:hypothetical protein [Fusobacterium necrophorum]EHO16117.1 hypothetical protein HMPREF9466_03178 [Fusobacterium necrophorum subsp. funduliforme 1_1_36S]AVQ20404.1 hypothetical protein C4N15_01475 [Fusobacterium necrophorum subsp. funduliforme]EYD68441.1 hypothetical protein FNF_09762 [Fusobacterium necrophorum subsp. funduliforme B35]KDE63908.1 hypothetical protein FUSO5_07425 [Fusobacterium necrophorum BFTR-1]KDE65002.1 hypothetical protein FUSO4_06915 [Fusobacterium necrophorum DJ-1]